MKTLSTLALAGVLAFGVTAAFAQNNTSTSGNTSMTAPAKPNTGKVNPTGDQKQVDPMAKGKPKMMKHKKMSRKQKMMMKQGGNKSSSSANKPESKDEKTSR
jgi:hypothetical protein